MSHSALPRKSALLVIDAQQSFTRMPYWTGKELPQFLQALQRPAARIVDMDACLASL